MKTRRSVYLEKDSLNTCMKSVLFPEDRHRNKSAIVPETPESYNVPSNSTTILASVLETPDDAITTQRTLKSTNNDANKCNKKQNTAVDVSTILDATPDLNLYKRKGIISILESEYSFAKSLMTQAATSSMYVPAKGENKFISPKRNKRKSLAETSLPFDNTNCNENVNKKKQLSLNSTKTVKEIASPLVKSSPRRASLLEYRYRRKSTIKGVSINMSIENSFVNNEQSFQLNGMKENNRTVDVNITKNSFDNSNLDLTNGNCGPNIILQKQKQSLNSGKKIPTLNFNSTDDEMEVSDRKGSPTPRSSVQPGEYSLFRNFSTLSCKEYEKQLISNKKNSLCIENQSPISNYNQRILQTELSPVTRSIFQSQDSLPPTQPSSVLVLQGIIAFVDVRSGAENRSYVFKEVLSSLGAEIVDKFWAKVTHVIFRDGSKSTYQRSIQRGVHLVSPLWVDACRVKLVRVSESLFPISSEHNKDQQTLTKLNLPRKLKSMQPRDFDEDMLRAEARLERKRKKRLQSNVSGTSEEVFTPPPKPILPPEGVNSPLFGIGHLLTPTRESRCSRSSEGSDTQASSTEKEFNTPLATRMYNRLFSPKLNLAHSPVKRALAPSNDNPNGAQVPPLANEQKKRQSEAEIPDPRRCSGRLSRNYICSSEVEQESSDVGKPIGRLNGDDENANNTTSSDMEEIPPEAFVRKPTALSESTTPGEPQGRIKPRKSILKGKYNDPSRRSARLSVSYKFSDNDSSTNRQNMSGQGESGNLISFKKGSKFFHPNLGNSNSLPLLASSQNSPITIRKRRLHTVDILDPSGDLIVPSTPPVSEHRTAGLYDELKVQSIPASQREQLNRITKKKNGQLKVFPLPRTTSKSKCKKEPVTPRRDKRPNSASDSSATTTDEDRTPGKGRFSLVPRKRSSIEEFQSPRRRRWNAHRKSSISNHESLPSICVTSVHSHNIGSIYAIIKSLGGFHMTADVDSKTTHVVCGSDRRTINVLQGISFGCWILDVSWLYESVEMLKWAPEEPFELFNFCPGAKISRINRSTSFAPPLLSDLGRIYVSESCLPSPYIIQNILHNCGANLCSTIRSADLIVGPKEDRLSSVKQVSIKWLFDSIQFWETKNLDEYLISQ